MTAVLFSGPMTRTLHSDPRFLHQSSQRLVCAPRLPQRTPSPSWHLSRVLRSPPEPTRRLPDSIADSAPGRRCRCVTAPIGFQQSDPTVILPSPPGARSMFSVTKRRRPPSVHQLMNGWEKSVYPTADYYSTIKRNEMLTLATAWMNFKYIALNSYREGDKL